MFLTKFHKYVPQLQLSLQHINSRPTTLFHRGKASYVVLLPEVPDDTAENNPLLSSEDQINFEELDAEKCYTGVAKHCLNYETGVWAVEKNIKENSEAPTFENVILELEKLDSPLTYAWSTVKTLYSTKNNVVSTSTYLKIHERARKARAFKFQSQPIYNACKEIYLKETNLDEAQKRVVRKFLLEARLNGVELPSQKSENLMQVLKKLEDEKSFYRRKLQESSKRFSYRIIDHEIVRDFPPRLLKSMAYNSDEYLKGPWTVTHHPTVYHRFMEHCPHKDLRWNAWNAYIMRASVHLSNELSNSVHIEEIRSLRLDQAKLLGFKNFAEMSMETKMAGSVDNILSVITSLFSKAKDQQGKEIEALKEFAQSRGFSGDLEECDIPYWRRKWLVHTSEMNEVELEKYFPFEHVWSQLLALSSNLFGVHFEEVPSGTFRAWHPHVRLYNVLDSDGKMMSSFYLDPFRRPTEKLETENNSAWMMTLKTRCDVTNTLPVASLVFNFNGPSSGNGEDNSPLLSFEEVQSMFKKLGHALQHLLSTVPYGQASGLTNIEWDAVELCSNFLLNWLYEPSILEKVSRHQETGEPLSQSGISNLITQRSHMASYDLCQELFLSHFDLKLYSEETFWLDILRELWPIYMPFELSKKHALPCWFSPIISDVWAGAYYSHTWSKMLAADAFSACKECEPQEVTQVGRRFRETFLSMGGGAHPATVFRLFRGRDPTPEALRTQLQIT